MKKPVRVARISRESLYKLLDAGYIVIIARKNKGEGNGRAIWNILTPDGKFNTIRDVAKFYGICTAAVHKRLASVSGKFKGWKKELK